MPIWRSDERVAISCEEKAEAIAMVRRGELSKEEICLETLASNLRAAAMLLRRRGRELVWKQLEPTYRRTLDEVRYEPDDFETVSIRQPVKSIDGPEAVRFLECFQCEEGVVIDHTTTIVDFERFLKDHRTCRFNKTDEGW
jgi:hypothetical protein